MRVYDAEMKYLLTKIDGIFDGRCGKHIHHDWSHFGGPASNYGELEKKYLNGATTAALCGIKFGWVTAVWLKEFSELHQSKEFSGKPLKVQLREATSRTMHLPLAKLDQFTDSVNCTATTPHIQFSDPFSQTVFTRCTTKYGDLQVNLHSLYITLNGDSVWNGPDRSYFGYNFRIITGL